MASIWKGSLSFGLVSIPVELKSAVRAEHVSFRLLYKKDLTPVKYERYTAKGEGPLPWSDIVKGFEIEKGHYVVLTEDDFRAAALGKSSSIDILDFVEQGAIDPRYFETPYYLLPAKGGEKPYALLREAIRRTGTVGIGKITMRSNSHHLVGVKVVGDALVLEIMRFADELVETSAFEFPGDAGMRKPELDMAKSLVNSLAAEWDPTKYTDQYRENLLKLIQAKLKGKKVDLEEAAEPRQAEVVDLMERLRRSLEQSGARPSKARPRAAKRPAKKRPKAAA